MKILSINSYDSSGLSYNLCTALNKYFGDKVEAISTITQRTWWKHPEMMFIEPDSWSTQIQNLIQKADIIHVSHEVDITKFLTDKPVITHLHVPIRDKDFYEQRKNSIFIASTPNTVEVAKSLGYDCTWFPSCVPVGEYHDKYFIKDIFNSKYLRLSHASSSIYKGTLQLKGTVKDLGIKGLNLTVIEGKPLEECLNIKRWHNVTFDNILGTSYGTTSIESAAMQHAILVGMSEYSKSSIKQYYDKIPFIDVNKDNLKEKLSFLANVEYRKEMGKMAYDYVSKVHDSRISAQRFLDIIKK